MSELTRDHSLAFKVMGTREWFPDTGERRLVLRLYR